MLLNMCVFSNPTSLAIAAATNEYTLIENKILIGERVVNKACNGFTGADISNKCTEIRASNDDFMPNIVGDMSK